MGILSTAGWLLNRPQQAFFQGAKRGSQAVGREGEKMRNLFDRLGIERQTVPLPYVGDVNIPEVLGMLNTADDFIKGFGGGLIGSRPDVRGKELTGDKYTGTALELAADPLAVIPFGKAAPLVNKGLRAAEPLARMGRTGVNLARLGKRNKPLAEALKEVPLRRRISQLDIPKIAGPGEPQAILTKRPAGWTVPEVRGNAPGASSERSRSFYDPKTRAAFINRETAEVSAPHEFTHYYVRDGLKRYPGKVGRLLDTFARENPSYVKDLRMRGYDFEHPFQYGDEMLARSTAARHILDSPVLKGFQKTALHDWETLGAFNPILPRTTARQAQTGGSLGIEGLQRRGY